jgi:hypothetical protein
VEKEQEQMLMKKYGGLKPKKKLLQQVGCLPVPVGRWSPTPRAQAPPPARCERAASLDARCLGP